MGLVAQSSSTSQSKRILQDSTSSRRNEQASPSKRRKLEDGANKFVKPARRDVNGGLVGSSQPKSHFESEVLEKLTQDIGTLKKKNAEKDQHWGRPSLDDFNEKTDRLTFQQIDAEEGTFQGGNASVKLFGVTDDGHSVLLHVTDFKHYLYVAAPVNFGTKD